MATSYRVQLQDSQGQVKTREVTIGWDPERTDTTIEAGVAAAAYETYLTRIKHSPIKVERL
jgi:hypothetical protein